MNLYRKAELTLQKTALKLHAVEGMNSGQVTLHWIESTKPAGYHPSDQSTYPLTTTPHSLIFQAMIHYVNHGVSTYQRFAEVQSGDVILDIFDSVPIDGKEHPRFEINGQFYTQKSVGDELAAVWDAKTGADRTFRTVLLKPAN